ncbi:MAG TPA: GNAT family N-acetyltransferase [Kofleriaceae bacterium]|nr:GNAT family N-acetyltransferase [Kofleriaceae bacterium]
MHSVEIFTALTESDLRQLATLLVDVVDDGASVSFLPPLAREDALAFWRRQQLADGGAFVIARDPDDDRIDGVVMLVPAWAPNQRHHAEVAKLLVHPRARRRGLANTLMQALEDHAERAGFSLITLDTWRDGAADALYRARGFVAVGAIPDYAKLADGRLCDTVIFYKRLSPRSAR